jgi:hypothetical protein
VQYYVGYINKEEHTMQTQIATFLCDQTFYI